MVERRERTVNPARQIVLAVPTEISFRSPRIPILRVWPTAEHFDLHWGSLRRRLSYPPDGDPYLVISNAVIARFGTLDKTRGFGVDLDTRLPLTVVHNI